MVSRRLAWLVAIVVTLTMTVSFVDRMTLAVLAPTVTKELDISEGAYGWLTAAFSFAYLASMPIAGWWIDRVGARRGLVASVLMWSGVAALHAVVPGFGMLLCMRIALGLAEGPGFPGGAQTMQRMLSPADRPRGFGLLFTGSSIGTMIAPLIATSMLAAADWRVAFLGTAAIGLLWVPLWIGVTSVPAIRAQLDTVPATATPQRHPSLFALVTHPAMIRGQIAIFAFAPITGFFQAWGSKYLVRMQGVDQLDVGHYLWLPPLAFDVSAIVFGDLISRLRGPSGGSPRILVAIAMCMCASVMLLPFADSAWHAIAVAALAVGGGGAMYTLVFTDLVGRMPPGSVSFAGGILAGAQSLALIISNPLIGRAVGYYENYDVVAFVLGAWAIPGSLIWIAWRPRAWS